MRNPRILAAFDLPPDATGAQIAARMRELAGLPADPDTNVALWERFIEGIELGRAASSADLRADLAELANGIVSWAIVPPGRSGEDRFGTIPWDHELGVPFPGADDVLRDFVFDEIGPRLGAAGIYDVR
jgi:hypothetical protein